MADHFHGDDQTALMEASCGLLGVENLAGLWARGHELKLTHCCFEGYGIKILVIYYLGGEFPNDGRSCSSSGQRTLSTTSR